MRRWAVWPLAIAGLVAFAQVVSFRAVALGLALGCLVVWYLAFTVAMRHLLLGLLVAAVSTVVLTLLAEVLGGTTNGPVARSMLLASGLVGVMSVLVTTPWPMLASVPGLMMLGAALLLGGGSGSLLAIGVSAVALATTAAMLGPLPGRTLRVRTRLVPLAAVLLAVGLIPLAAGAVTWAFAGGSSASSAPLLGSFVAPTGIQPSLAPTTPDTPPPVDPASAEPVFAPEPAGATANSESRVVEADSSPWWVRVAALVALVSLLVFLLGLLALLYFIARRLWFALCWARVRRRLRAGNARDRSVGAWEWVRLRQARRGEALPVWWSPDVAASEALHVGERDMALVATIASHAAFDLHGAMSMPESGRAWDAAIRIGRSPRGATLNERWEWAGRSPRGLGQEFSPEA